MKHVDHRIVVANRRIHEPLSIVGVRWRHNLHSWHVGEGRIQTLRMLTGIGVTAPNGSHQNHGYIDLTT